MLRVAVVTSAGWPPPMPAARFRLELTQFGAHASGDFTAKGGGEKFCVVHFNFANSMQLKINNLVRLFFLHFFHTLRWELNISAKISICMVSVKQLHRPFAGIHHLPTALFALQQCSDLHRHQCHCAPLNTTTVCVFARGWGKGVEMATAVHWGARRWGRGMTEMRVLRHAHRQAPPHAAVSNTTGFRASKGQVWTGHLAPAAPAFTQPSLCHQFSE